MPDKKKIFIGLTVIIAAGLVVIAGYFYNCAASHPLFSYNRKLDPALYQYRYYLGKRLYFCWNFLSQPKLPKGQDLSKPILIMGPQAAFRLPVGTPRPSDYNSSPPTSGWNYPLEGKYAVWKTPRHRFYQYSIKSEVAVTELYAGFVWITYKRGEVPETEIETWRKAGIDETEIKRLRKLSEGTTGVSEDVVEELKKIAGHTPLVIVSSRAHTTDGADIVLSALGRQDRFNLEDGKLTQEHIDRIWDFLLRWRNQPEPFVGVDLFSDEFSEEGSVLKEGGEEGLEE